MDKEQSRTESTVRTGPSADAIYEVLCSLTDKNRPWDEMGSDELAEALAEELGGEPFKNYALFKAKIGLALLVLM